MGGKKEFIFCRNLRSEDVEIEEKEEERRISYQMLMDEKWYKENSKNSQIKSYKNPNSEMSKKNKI